MPNLQTYYHFQLDFQKVDKWLIHDTKLHKDSQLQSLDIKSPKITCSIQYSRRMSRGGNIQGVVHLQKQHYLGKKKKPKVEFKK